MHESTTLDNYQSTSAKKRSHSLTPEQLALRAKMGAHKLWSTVVDRPAQTAAARDAFMSRFADQADPDGSARQAIVDAYEQGDEEQAQALEDALHDRIDHAKSEHFTRLAYASSRARANRARHSNISEPDQVSA